MGWANCGDDEDGRPIGYAIQATCDHPGCDKEIDRGLDYVCGNMHGGDGRGCGKYFCHAHLSIVEICEDTVQLCDECTKLYPDEEDQD
jgi:hypothetical protein